jgi:hypothetical protein
LYLWNAGANYCDFSWWGYSEGNQRNITLYARMDGRKISQFIMNLVQISNLFNVVCIGINQQTPNRIGFYHYGWYSDINANISNNWTGDNALGRLYPAVQFMYPTATIEVKEKSVKGSLRCRMVVSRPQYYENDGSYINQSIIEAQAEMEALAINIISEFNRIARIPANGMSAGIQNPITIDYLSDAHNENLVLVDVAFNLWYVWDCPTDTVNVAGLPAPYDDLPLLTIDYENAQFQAPVNTTPPTISGNNIVGALLKVTDNGVWSGTIPITFTYQWKRNGIDISGETTSEYTTVLADLGKSITCEVTATNIVGSASQISNSITIV